MQKQPEQQVADILPTFTASVKVSDPEPDAIKGFYTYLISGTDDLGSFEIRRRYNDFFYFRQSLAKKWPGIYIPPIPEKKIAGNKDVENIEIRKKFFDYFMRKLGRIKHLFTCPITREFLRNKSVDMQKFLATMVPPRYDDLLMDYRKVYEKLNLKNQHTHEIKNTILNFDSFLKKAQKQLQGLREQVQIIVDARAGFTMNLNNCSSTILPQYEQNVYSEYLPEQEKKQPALIFANNMKVHGSIKLLKDASVVNSFVVCLDHITYQILQIRAMEEALKIKERYQTDKKDKENELLEKQGQLAKLNSGKTTLKSIFSRGSKNEQIQKLQLYIPELQREIASLEEFNNVLTVVLGMAELPIFKRNKQVQYYRMMYQVSQNQIKYLAAYGELMKSIMQGIGK